MVTFLCPLPPSLPPSPSLTEVTFGLKVLREFVSLLYFLKGDQSYSCLRKIAGTFISCGQSVV